ncbi:MAG TPA: TIM-barrel domain-containing protein [Anaerolineales bacterium]|nr:TIM-barrel domain-containing protein [Anaerolineales bacterium]
MTDIPAHLVPEFKPIADPDAVIARGRCRVTVLTPRLLRIEYGPDGGFEDRASQAFWFRRQPVPEFESGDGGAGTEDGGAGTGDGGAGTGDGGRGKGLVVETGFLRLSLADVEAPFAGNLRVELKKTGAVWRYGDPDTGNLKGTYRTLDTVDGSVRLEPGLISRDGWVVVDDSKTLVFGEDGWLAPRDADTGRLDLYFFGHGRDYRAALADFRAVAGPVPLLPRWALGNWWSRYWAYTDAELRNLILDFEAHEVPLSVCIIDMDWHITDTGNASSGWTGYTWNRDLFPDPDETLAFIHQHGLQTALNLHPSDGIWPHEAQYAEFAERMGLDPQSGEPVRFDLADPKFAAAYFELLHHPEEARGVDFWWIDWQQGTLSGMPGLDPLWWLNHLHFLDLGRQANRRMGELANSTPADSPIRSFAHSPTRPFIFSRWGGLGNHRYPIGFSGDTVISWDSLSFQPYFTSTAANVGYGWWSHDIGGHYGGSPAAELYARWVQYGVFSPILRLHSTRNPLLERRPFGWDAETFRLTRDAMRLRHRLIPYLYTMSWRDHSAGEAPIRPMYHDHPEEPSAYACPDQYTFGSELIAAPFTEPLDPDTGLARRVVWLPEERWNFLTGAHFEAGWHAVYGGMDDTPVFAKPGAIVPLCEPDDWRDPSALEIHIFPGASSEFKLYEDDGVTNAYQSGDYRLTEFTFAWSEKHATFNLKRSARLRTYTFVFHAVAEPKKITAVIDGEPVAAATDYDPQTGRLTVSPPDLGEGEALEVRLEGASARRTDDAARVEALQRMVRAFRTGNDIRQVLIDSVPEIVADPEKLPAFKVSFKDAHLRALLEVLLGAGVYTTAHTGEPQVVVWNRDGRPEVTYGLATEHHRTWLSSERFQLERGQVPAFKAWWPAREFKEAHWLLTVRFGDLLEATVRPPDLKK